MDIREVRARFDAYCAGTATAEELRAAVAAGLAADPGRAASLVSLVTAFARSGVLGEELRATLLALLPVAPAPPGPASRPDGEAATRYAGGARPDGRIEPRIVTTGTTPGSSTSGSAWDSPERLAEPGEPLGLGSVLKQRFELVAELGRGGMGVVFKALDRANAELKDRDPFVAIKVLSEEFKRHPLAVRSLQREARKAQKLAHPNIVTVYDFDRDGGNVFMIMELLEGQSLEQLLRHEGAGGLPLARVEPIVHALGEALAYAHEQGIVHADFKPSNAFLTAAGVVKVLDFGIARAAQSRVDGGDKTLFDVSQLGAVSPPYASLEMLRGDPPDPRDDIYALACVTYELLAGRHPFNRIDAQKARGAGLEPAPLRGLGRAQWQALRKALAFEREQRSASVGEFTSGLAGRRASRAWLVPAALLVMAALGGALLVPGQWQAYQGRRLATAIAGAAPAAFAQAFADLAAAPAAVRSRALANDGARKALIEHFRSETALLTAAPAFDYAAARQRLAELARLLPDSGAVADLQQRLDQAARVELLRQLELRDRLLDEGALVAAQAPQNVSTVLARIRRIDPANRALTDPRLPGAYATAARGALDAGRLELGQALVEAGLGFAATDPRLLDLKDRIAIEVARSGNLRRADEIRSRLASLDPTAGDFLEQALARRDDLAALSSIDAGDPALKRLQAGLEAQAGDRIRQRVAADDVAGAQDLLLNVGDLLPQGAVAGLRAVVLDGARLQESRALDSLDRLRRAVLTGRVAAAGGGGALDLYAELQRSGASPDLLAEARDLVAYGYLRESRRARLGGDAGSAARRLQAAVALRPGPSLQAMLDGERQVLEARGAAAPGVAALDAARGRFAASLHAPALGGTELAAMAESLDRLESIGSSAQEVAAGLRQVEDRVLAEYGRLQKGSADQAQLFARQAAAALPASERLAEAARALRAPAGREAAPAAAAPGADNAAQRQQLATLLAHAEASDRWAGELRRALQRLGALLPAGDRDLADARRVAATTFAQAAAAARGQRRYAEATRLVGLGRAIDPDATALAAEQQAIERDRGASEAAAATDEQRASVEAVKQRLADQAGAGDVAGATATANALRRALAGSVYVAQQVPALVISAYVHRAKAEAAAGRVDAALQTLADGRRKFGSSAELKSLEARYVVVGDSYDRLSTAINVNVAEQRRYLDSLRASEGSEYPVVERMLAQTLADRIADQKAAGRGSVVATLLDGGRKLFPEHAELLEKGTAGALPTTPLAVGVDEGPAKP